MAETLSPDRADASHHPVADAAGLRAALEAARDGDTIHLSAGDYGTLDLTDYHRDVRLVADPEAPAVLRGLDLRGVSGLDLDGLVLDFTFTRGMATWERPFRITDSRDMVLQNLLIDGDDAFGTGTVGDGAGAGSGLVLEGCAGLRLQDSEIRGFWKGVHVLDSRDVALTGNEIHDMRVDMIVLSEVTDLLIEDNHLHGLRRAPGAEDHADMIQLLSKGADTPTTGLTIRGNLIEQGAGDAGQSIFLNNRAVLDGAGPELFHRDILIEDNVIVNAQAHGITVGATDGLVVRNNSVLHTGVGTDAGSVPRISIAEAARDVTVAGNVTGALKGHAGQGDWQVAGNVTLQNTDPAGADHYSVHFADPGRLAEGFAEGLTLAPDSPIAGAGAGAAALRDTAGSPDGGGDLPIDMEPMPEAGPVRIEGGLRDDVLRAPETGGVLRGLDGADRLRAGSGADWLEGGAGADQFIIDLRGGAQGGTDRLADLDFSEGDWLRILTDRAGLFDLPGVGRSEDGSDLRITSAAEFEAALAGGALRRVAAEPGTPQFDIADFDGTRLVFETVPGGMPGVDLLLDA